MKLKHSDRLDLHKDALVSSCDEFKELVCSDLVDVRSGCIALITRDKNENCIEGVGIIMSYCPFCGCKIKSNYNVEKGYWEWWHN